MNVVEKFLTFFSPFVPPSWPCLFLMYFYPMSVSCFLNPGLSTKEQEMEIQTQSCLPERTVLVGREAAYHWIAQLWLSPAVAFISGELTVGSVQCESRIYLAYCVTLVRGWQCIPSTNKTQMMSLISFLPHHPILKIVIFKCICHLDIFLGRQLPVTLKLSVTFQRSFLIALKKRHKSIILQNGGRKKT